MTLDGHSHNDLILGRGGGITTNIVLLKPEEYRPVQEDAVRHLDERGHDNGDEDLQLLKEALGLDGISAA